MYKYSKILIKNIGALMQAAGMNQTQFAKKLKIAPGNVNKWMAGKNVPSVGACENIAAVFGVSVADLFKTNETPKPQMADLPETVRLAIEDGNAKLMAQITQKLESVTADLQKEGVEEVIVREMPKDKLQVFFNRLLREPGFSGEFYALIDEGADFETIRKHLLKELQAQEKTKK